MNRNVAILSLATAVIALPALSSANFLNTGFETGTSNNGTWNYKYNPTDALWSFTNGAGLVNNANVSESSSWASTAYELNQFAFLQNGGGVKGSVAQSLTLAAGTYTVSFAYKTRTNYAQPGGSVNDLLLSFGTFNQLVGITSQSDAWKTQSYTFSLASTTTAMFTFEGQNLGANDVATYLDDVNIAQAVPEPFTMAMALGGLAVGFRRIRKARASK